jgi:hypothetical protein
MPHLEGEPRNIPEELQEKAENKAPLEAAPEADIEKEPEDPSVRFEDLPKEEQERLLPYALAGMRMALSGVKDYAVFASTAMYLNGERLKEQGDEAGEELMTPPGDFDAAVFSEQSLEKIRSVLGNMQDKEASHHVEFDHEGKYVTIPGEEMKKLAGKFVFNAEVKNGEETEVKPVKYDFEFFYKSRVVSPELAQGRTLERDGLQILNLEGLQKQYENNLEFEGRIENNVNALTEELQSEGGNDFRTELAAWDGETPLSQETRNVLDHLEVKAEDMKEVFELQQKIDAIDAQEKKTTSRLADLQKLQVSYRSLQLDKKLAEIQNESAALAEAARKGEDEKRKLISARAILLAGTKTKLWKRELNVLQLARLRGK